MITEELSMCDKVRDRAKNEWLQNEYEEKIDQYERSTLRFGHDCIKKQTYEGNVGWNEKKDWRRHGWIGLRSSRKAEKVKIRVSIWISIDMN